MNSFRTPVKVPKAPFEISYNSKMLLMGSCFTEHIGERLNYFKLPEMSNPFGIVYNPISIASQLSMIMKPSKISKQHLVQHDGLWHSMSHHGAFSDSDADIVLGNVNEFVDAGSTYLKQASVLFLSLGTAWVYKYKKTGAVVSNCHKIPATEFERYMIDVKIMVEQYSKLFADLKAYNSNLQIVFTVSPIRHLKDGATGNQLSKATLLLAINQLVERFNYAHYFPSYEIMMDDLRDYRFYEADMIHPNQTAVTYIWNQFKEAYISKKAAPLMDQIAEINRAKQHRPFNQQSEAHQKFLRGYLKKVVQIKAAYPSLDLKDEAAYFSKTV